MANLSSTLNQTASLYKMAISYVQNDRKIAREFKSIQKKKNTANSLREVKDFLESYKSNPELTFPNDRKAKVSSESWLDTVLELLPSLIDSELIMSPRQALKFVKEENKTYIFWR